MSNNDNNANNTQNDNAEPQATQSTKGRRPDYYVSEVFQKDGRDQFKAIGALWHGKEGYLSGQTDRGRLVLQSREVYDALKEIRDQKKQAEQAQAQPQQDSQQSPQTQTPIEPSQQV